MRNLTSTTFQIAVLAAAFASPAFASSTVFTISPYNILAFGSISDNADFGGGVAAMGQINISGTTIAGALLGEALSAYTGSETLIAGGNLDAINGTLAAGNAYGGGSANDFSLTITSGSYTHSPAADPLSFSALQSSLDSLSSATLATQTATAGASCVKSGSTTTCTANATGVNYINVTDATMFGGSQTVNITLGANSSVVFNVSGTNDSITTAQISINGSGPNGDTTTAAANRVLFNYYQATNLEFSSVVGSVLAPYATVQSASSGQIDGQLIATSFAATGGLTEFHNFGFTGTLPSGANPTPEPMSLVLIGAGLISIGLIGRARKAKAQLPVK